MTKGRDGYFIHWWGFHLLWRALMTTGHIERTRNESGQRILRVSIYLSFFNDSIKFWRHAEFTNALDVK